MSELLTKLTLDGLRQTFQGAGYRVETASDPIASTTYLRSATAGLAFEIRPGNRLPGDDEGFVDATLMAAMQVQGELPLDVINRWNATRRFGRLQLSLPFLVFHFDICVAGGVTRSNLQAQIEIWDRLVQELIGYLRDELSKLAIVRRETTSVPPPVSHGDAAPKSAAGLDNSATVQ
jgi:hypothetical protein